MEADREDEIRARAYQLWEEEGRPEGRAEQHWFTAKESLAIEENQESTYLPIDTGTDPEPIEAVENTGEFPTLTDQGELQTPHRAESGEPPSTPPANN
ncbi:conserved hypothetical protein [uncultured Pleomorphomonas sp.]|uniref:DUF2934 domain-containing protein n=1 Tax=uncultured Pleomorphomonas sp. TaxID=442121 RepID=A0A212LEF0_9HYPH|nr:DUF2934 domain-containing protein [uncultured Pleomorphomonas sp.]SCM75848.1 conserved hypothetical protein [uncultured Pleomorphomonas sp.]